MRTEYDAEPEDEPEKEKPKKTKRQRRAEARKLLIAQKCPLCRCSVVDHARIAHSDQTWCHECLEKCGEEGRASGKSRNHQPVGRRS